MATTQMLLTIGYSYRLFPISFTKNKGCLAEGMGMVRLGIAFVVAGILGSGADFVIRSFLSYTSSLETVGLYSAGYMMTMTYAGMVFSAMETDFFPRLSANHKFCTTSSTIINRQIEVSLLLVSPLLVFFTIALPILMPLLYSGKFTPVVGMMQVTVFAMYFRAIKLPMAYFPLAKGDSWSYLFLEAVYDVLLVACVVLGFRKWGLLGCGIAITFVGLLDFLIILLYTRYKYGFHLSSRVRVYAMMQLPFGILAYLVTFVSNPWVYWGVGMLLGCASLAVSIMVLRKKTTLWESIKTKIKKKFRSE
jgi:O-antigen/teichoic acid export membrane protein